MSAPDLPRKVMPGMTTWVNEYGMRVVLWHYLSDPAKRGEWADITSRGIVGGRNSDHWRQEQEIDPFILRGRPTYFGFAYSRNVIEALPVEIHEFRSWTWFLSVDYGAGGSATCWLFWAESPSGDLVIFDEVYVDEKFGQDERTPEHIKPLVYQRLREWAGVPLSQPIDIRKTVKYCIGDPSGLSFSQEYRKQPMPLYIGIGSPDAKVKLNDIEAGEARLNAYFSASFVCCPTQDNPEGRWYVNRGLCPRCGAEKIGRPRLRILKHGAPHLIAQLPTIRKKLPRKPGEQPPAGNVRVEDHAEASARYGAMSLPVLRPEQSKMIATGPLREMQKTDRFWAHVEAQTANARLNTIEDADERDLALIEQRAYDNRRIEDYLDDGAYGPY